MEQKIDRNWPALVLASLCGLVLLAFLAGMLLTLLGGFSDWRETHDITTSLLPAVLTVTAMLFASVIVGRAGWLALQKIRGKPSEPARILSMPLWVGVLGFFGWAVSIALAIFLINRPVLQWLSLPFYLLAVVLPILALVRLSLGGLTPGSKLRAWATLAGGMTLAPLLSGLAELIGIILLLIPVGIYMGLDPNRLAEIQALADQLKNVGTQEGVLNLVAPYVTNPLVLIGALLFLSVITPLVEEIAKSLPVWFSWGRLESPAQGFALGALSGAGFGLMEGLFVSAAPGPTWGATLAVRAASSAMHIVTAGIVGWGIGLAATQKRALPVFTRYLLSMSIHGIWNACVVVLVYAGGLSMIYGTDIRTGIALVAAFGGLCFLAFLILAAPVTLWRFNRYFKKSIPEPVNPETVEPPADVNMVI